MTSLTLTEEERDVLTRVSDDATAIFAKYLDERLKPCLPIMDCQNYNYREMLSSSEQLKLAECFGIESDELSVLSCAVARVVRYSTYNCVDASHLRDALSSTGISTALADVLSTFYENNAVRFLEVAGSYCPSGRLVTRIDWDLGVTVCDSDHESWNRPKADLYLATSTGEPKAKEIVEGVSLDLEDMTMLYERFELMQQELDNLAKN